MKEKTRSHYFLTSPLIAATLIRCTIIKGSTEEKLHKYKQFEINTNGI